MLCCHSNGLYQKSDKRLKHKYIGILTGKSRETKLQENKIRLNIVTHDSVGAFVKTLGSHHKTEYSQTCVKQTCIKRSTSIKVTEYLQIAPF